MPADKMKDKKGRKRASFFGRASEPEPIERSGIEDTDPQMLMQLFSTKRGYTQKIHLTNWLNAAKIMLKLF